MQPKKRRQGAKQQKKLNVECLAVDATKKILAAKISSALESHDNPPSADVEECWVDIKHKAYEASLRILEPVQRRHQDWFDQNDTEIAALLEKKHAMHKALLSD